MKCPACSSELTEIKAGTIVVDVCKSGCRGVWFDWKELKAFDEPHEFAPEEILSARRAAVEINRGIRHCPKCADEALCRRFYDINAQVEVDQCLKCSGIWLDTGELQTIRGQYTTEEERIKAADSYLETQLQAHQQILDAEKPSDPFTPEERAYLKSQNQIFINDIPHRSAVCILLRKLFS